MPPQPKTSQRSLVQGLGNISLTHKAGALLKPEEFIRNLGGPNLNTRWDIQSVALEFSSLITTTVIGKNEHLQLEIGLFIASNNLSTLDIVETPLGENAELPSPRKIVILELFQPISLVGEELSILFRLANANEVSYKMENVRSVVNLNQTYPAK